MSNGKLMSFINEIVSEYSEFLFISNKTLNQIKEIDIVKSAFIERYGKYKKLYLYSEKELNELRKTHTIIKDV